MTHALGYFGPGPDVRRRGPSPWLVAGAIGALTGFCFFSCVPIKIGGRTQDARIAAANSDVASYSTMIDAFSGGAGRYPTDAEGLAALASQPAGLPEWNGPYVRQVKTDPWGHPYVYHRGGPSGGAGYRIISMGPDGRLGTPDDITGGSDAPPPPPTPTPSALGGRPTTSSPSTRRGSDGPRSHGEGGRLRRAIGKPVSRAGNMTRWCGGPPVELA